MKAIVSGLFGGGSAIIYVILAAIIGGFYLEYQDAKSDAAQFEAERDEWKSTALGSQSAVLTLSKQTARKSSSSKEANHAADQIRSVPDARHCQASEPVRAALDWVSDYRARRPEINPDSTNVSMPREAGTSKTSKPR